MLLCLYKKGNFGQDDMWRIPCEDKGGDLGDASPS